VFAEAGVTVVDWLQTDGEDIRSLGITLGLDPWDAAA
jgi:hypothetical protein